MNKNINYIAAGCFALSLVTLAVLGALGRDIPPILIVIVGGLFTTLQAFLSPVVKNAPALPGESETK